jgi:predicted SAM-dependent methyltransferase
MNRADGGLGGQPEISSASLSAYLGHIGEEHRDRSGWRGTLKQALTVARLPVERRRGHQFANSAHPLKLHLGCGGNYAAGWVNVDLARPGRRLDLRWDLRRPLPFPAGTADTIFTEHLLEHLPVDDGLRLLRECARLLVDGGVLRVAVPDLERYIEAYSGRDQLLDEVRPGRPTRGLAFCEVFFKFGHRSMYDFETLHVLCVEAGFSVVERSAFNEGRVQPSPDTPTRRAETLYVEAMK